MAAIPIFHPAVPFMANIPGGLSIGETLKIQGQMNPDANKRFCINIQKGPALDEIYLPREDKALHLSIRPSNGRIVRNTALSANWQAEEIYGGCPIQPGDHFEFDIVAEPTVFKIILNGHLFCTFNYRLLLQTNSYFVGVDGACTVNFIGRGDSNFGYKFNLVQPPIYTEVSKIAPPYMGNAPQYTPKVPPPPYQEHASIPVINHHHHNDVAIVQSKLINALTDIINPGHKMAVPIYNPSVPFMGNIPGGMHVGQVLRVRGQMNHGWGQRFTINLQRGPSTGGHAPRDEIALHLSIRPTDGRIVRNHTLGQLWQQEEIYGGCPIRPGDPFEFLIVAEQAFFRITLNGVPFCTYNYRMPLQSSTFFVGVDGACTIQFIGRDHDYGGSSAPIFNPVPPIYNPGVNTIAPPFQGHPPQFTPGPPPYQAVSSTTTIHHHHHSAPTDTGYGDKHKKSDNTALKCAVGIGATTLGVLAVASILDSESRIPSISSSSSSSSSSDDDY